VLKQIDVLGLHLQTFGIFFALNFLCWAAVMARRLKELDLPVDWAYELLFASLIGGLVGARLYFVAQNYDEVKGDVLGSLFSGAGLVWYGGLMGGVIAVLLWAWWRDFLRLQLLDLAAPALALGYAIGRIGCQVSGDGDYGKASDLPWAMGYPDGAVPTAPGVTVQPTPMYETLSMGLLAFFLWRLRDAFRPGALFGIYLVGAGLERFLVEFARRNEEVLGPFTAAQIESFTLIVAGLVWLLVLLRRHGTLRAEGAVSPPRTGRSRPAAA
jgi:phosphatidylglycerol:prolipoprotein diacylglycerol transferase